MRFFQVTCPKGSELERDRVACGRRFGFGKARRNAVARFGTMRDMGWRYLLGLAGLFGIGAGCGGQAASALESAPPSRSPCVSSFSCPDGERCDDGECVLDESCPVAQSPRLLYGPFDYAEDAFAGLWPVALAGRPYLYSPPISESPTTVKYPVEKLELHDLLSGGRSTLAHPLGRAYCQGDRVNCLVFLQDASTKLLMRHVRLDPDSKIWTPASTHEVPRDFRYLDWLAPGEGLVQQGSEIVRYSPEDGTLGPLLTTPFDRFSAELHGDPPHPYAVYHDIAGDDARYFVARLGEDAEWRQLPGRGAPRFSMSSRLFSAHGSWYIVEDGGFGRRDEFTIYRVEDNDTLSTVMEGDELLYEVQGVPRPADSSNAPVGGTFACSGRICRSARIDLDAGTIEHLARYEFTGPKIVFGYSRAHRWLACDAVDAVVVVRDEGTTENYEHWAIRLRPEGPE